MVGEDLLLGLLLLFTLDTTKFCPIHNAYLTPNLLPLETLKINKQMITRVLSLTYDMAPIDDHVSSMRSISPIYICVLRVNE